MNRSKHQVKTALVGCVLFLAALPTGGQILRQSPHADIKIACDVCHNPEGWKVKPGDVKFDHTTTDFPLEGRHKSVSCRDCHTTLSFKEDAKECASCHQEPHFGQFGVQCAVCHSPDGWENRSQMAARHALTRFPLAGAHREVDCLSCHTGGRYVGTPTECVGCHLPDFNATSSPAHTQAGFSGNCTACHSLDKPTWIGAAFTHTASFQLTGGHASQSCSECHQAGYANTSTACFSCHATAYGSTTNPNHAASEFSQICEQCHTTLDWRPAQFDHNLARFQLTGAHIRVDCASCHEGGRYTGTSQECYGCHQSDFQNVSDPNHVSGAYDHNCAACHTTADWKPASINHDGTRFPLIGAHRAVDCASCHTTGYNGTATACFDCHRAAFETVRDPSHVSGSYNHDCTACHAIDGWKPARIDHNQTRFPLTGAHVTASCESCHQNNRFNGTPLECYTCHRADFDQVQQPNHVQSQFDHDCIKCHSTVVWKPATFDHQQSTFPLTGAHRTTDCLKCHVNGQFTGTSSECFTCHRVDFEQVAEPNHTQGRFDHNCVQCHSTDAWKPSTFNHQATDFPLTGAHKTADCASCHSSGQFNGLAGDCWSCHRADFEGTNNPNHTTLNYTHECAICHATTDWSPAKVDHSLTSFPLTGAHRIARCDQCHVAQRYSGTSTECFACHNPEYADAENPNHIVSNFDRNCSICHTTARWSPASFDHNIARFPLTGAHRTVACASCHIGGQYSGIASDCWSCHRSEYEAVVAPSHTLAQMDHNCTTCHSTDGWKPATFDHAQTNYPLTGAHRTVDCASCHVNGRYAGLPNDCWSCHQQTFTDVQDPSHVQGQFDHNCTTCHSTDGWKPATFDHDRSNYPLTGAHRTVDCASCHVNGRFAGTPTDCWSCHQQTFNDVQDPSHVQGQFDHNCTTCHSTDGWNPATFDHDRSNYPLTGAHRTVDCASCHINGRFAGTPMDCWTCHQQSFAEIQDPNHVQGQYDHNCTICHTTTAWQPAQFDHNGGDFPLTGAHQQVQCASCHVNGRFGGTPTDCWTCHQAAYQNVQDPNHVQGQYNHNCTICHTTTAWQPAQFDHNGGDFPLTGAHRQVQCASCHVNGRFGGTPTDCYACHTNDFNNVGNPNHRNAQFPHDCTLCHTTNNWDSNFNQQHDQQWFPVYSGEHRGEWANCAECHNNPNDYQVFTCITCHEHSNRAEVDSDHREVRDYAYNSAACYRCHPTGRQGDINHPIAPR